MVPGPEGGHWDIREVQRPTVPPGHLLLRVHASSINRAEFRRLHNLRVQPGKPAPEERVGGGDAAGEIAELGAGVVGFKPGDRAMGRCAGGFAEYVLAPASHVHPVPTGITPFIACFAEPITIGIHACQRGQISAGEYVLVLGCGPIGLAIIEVALNLGAHVVASDLLSSRLEIAQRLGAQTIHPDDALIEKVLAQTMGEGAPVVVEATGSPKVMQSTVNLVAAGGRIVIRGGNLQVENSRIEANTSSRTLR